MLEKIESRRRRGQLRMRWIASPTQWTWVWENLDFMKDREAWYAAILEVLKSCTQLNNWTVTTKLNNNIPNQTQSIGIISVLWKEMQREWCCLNFTYSFFLVLTLKHGLMFLSKHSRNWQFFKIKFTSDLSSEVLIENLFSYLLNLIQGNRTHTKTYSRKNWKMLRRNFYPSNFKNYPMNHTILKYF